MTEQTPEKSNSRKILLTALIAILVALNGVLFYLNIKERDKNKALTATNQTVEAEKDATLAKLDSLEQEYDKRIAEIQKLGGDVESLQKVKEQLEKDKVFLRSSSAAERKKYIAQIKKYEEMLVAKDEEIVVLKQQNETLYGENSELKTKQVKLSDSLSAIDAQKRDLAEKVRVGGQLKAENLTINVLNEKGKERDGGEYKAKRIDRIKIMFDVAENKISESGTHTVYMRLVEPDGAAVFDMATGGGTFNYDGKETFYTAKKDILYDKTRQKVDFVFSKGTPYKEGKHMVELYADGFQIGTGSFVVK
jgi:regulator of replication initiation timing